MSNTSAFTAGLFTGGLYVIILVLLTLSEGSLTKEECEKELKQNETCTPLWFPEKEGK